MEKFKTLGLSLLVIALLIYFEKQESASLYPNEGNSDAVINSYFQNKQSDRQIAGAGYVLRTLADDTQGSRHQRFILELESGQTLLISHNIDLAPKITSLEAGDFIEFNGEYEWTPEGGVVHWTHHDPNGSHQGGWLKHQSGVYQ